MDNNNENPGFDYKPSGTAVAERPAPQASGAGKPPRQDTTLSWTASEFIEHDRGVGWYLLLIIATIGTAGITYVLTKDYITVGVILVLGIIVGVAVGRKPRQIQYQLTSQGIQVGEKPYTYSQFRSFSIIREGTLSSVELIPLKKVMLPISAYFGPGDEERIVDIIGQHLPYEQRKMDFVDRLSRRLRF